jgi:VCBS repeat-containing protein
MAVFENIDAGDDKDHAQFFTFGVSESVIGTLAQRSSFPFSDEDWYGFSLSQSATLHFSLASSDSLAGLIVYYADGLTAVANGIFAGGSGQSDTILTPGTYYLDVHGNPFVAPSSYTITLLINSQPVPDLIVSSITPNATSVTQGQTFGFSYVIQDNSSAPVTVSTSAGIYLDGQRIKSDAIGAISANGTNPGSDSFSTAGLSVGQHTLTVKADDTQLVNEGSNENNNASSLTFNVTGVSQNHSPVITSKPTTATVTEFVGKPSGTHQAIGTITFTDLDLTDIHTASASKTFGASGFPSDFFIQPATIAATGNGTGAVNWTYSISDSAIDKLAAGQVVPQVFTLTIDDGHGGTASQDITILLTGTNDAPVANDDSLSVSENSAIAVLGPGILFNDTDVDGNNLTAVLASGPSHGSLTFHTDGSFTYMPLANYFGADSFTYFANDGTTNSATAATVSITVNQTIYPGTPGNDNLVGTARNELFIGGADIITPALGDLPGQTGQMGSEWHVVSSQDFSGDGKGDIMWVRNTTGDAALWAMNNGTLSTFYGATQGHMGPEWTAAGSGDFNRDGKADLVWTHTGDVALWLMNGPNLTAFANPSGHMGPEWHVQGIGDFNGDGFSDILWHSDNGAVADWSMNGTALGGFGISNGAIGKEWGIGSVGDFNGDGRDDILWLRNTGDVQTWTMNGSNYTGITNTGHMGTEWHVGGAGDFNMDGKTDLVWVSDSNDVQIWEMNGGNIAQIVTPSGHMGTEWHLRGVNDFTGDGRPDLLWVTDNGKTSVWNMVGNGDFMAGGGGSDTFQFNALNETGKVISDFAPGAGGDILDLHNLELATGYTGNDGLRDGSVRLIQNGANTEVQVDSHFGEHHWVDAVTLQNVNAAALIHANFLV